MGSRMESKKQKFQVHLHLQSSLNKCLAHHCYIKKQG